MRRAGTFSALLLSAGLTSPIQAQQAETVAGALDTYVRYCDLALSDPQALLTAALDPASGYSLQTASTEDGQVLLAFGMDEGSQTEIEIEIEIGAAGRKRVISCAVTFMGPGPDGTGALSDAFGLLMEARNDVTVTGGLSPVADFLDGMSQEALSNRELSYHCYTDGLLPMSQQNTRLVIGWGNLFFETTTTQEG